METPPTPDFLGAYKLDVKNWSENQEIISEIKVIVGIRNPPCLPHTQGFEAWIYSSTCCKL